ncbi:hypothetical protein [Streptomyces sp. ME19-01-6]|uniref:hypothetical protein n=1 Tax=Streptomyces sp. ME19-01-6 TaxID=3028686 RepID=UPI0029A6309E|nr:hypothetical protein [Streptomyces sp. ME19-01-6]MDX3224961.1 hypothetical protein [Streptomyces sp. ME19-01-6]
MSTAPGGSRKAGWDGSAYQSSQPGVGRTAGVPSSARWGDGHPPDGQSTQRRPATMCSSFGRAAALALRRGVEPKAGGAGVVYLDRREVVRGEFGRRHVAQVRVAPVSGRP